MLSIIDRPHSPQIDNLKPGQVVVFISDTTTPEQISSLRHNLNQFNSSDLLTVDLRPTSDPELVNRIYARMFNIGSLGHYNLVTGRLSPIMLDTLIRHLSNIKSLENKQLTNLDTPDSSFPKEKYRLSQNLSLPCSHGDEDEYVDYLYENKLSTISSASDSIQAEESVPPLKSEKQSRLGKLVDKFSKKRQPEVKRAKHRKEENAADELAANTVEYATRELLDRIAVIIHDYVKKTNAMPPMEEIMKVIGGKVVIGDSNISPIVVNGDLKIVLPDYNEMNVELRPLPLTVYLLFLRHPEGIVLNNIPDHRKELEQIYSLVMPNRDDVTAKASIDDLVDTTSGSLNQKISVIKRIFSHKIMDPAIAGQYYISGRRGEPYRIKIGKENIRLPQALRF